MRHAIINKENSKVVNVIEWEGSEWSPPKDHLVIQDDLVNTGDIYNPLTGTFSTPSLEGSQ